ncbi:hypothetical protein V9T40_008468 [Parthenolecanium corni]|uniref:Translocation protein SEC62 n=1 Tax=Parthenolecanium corni TaxID=536013 RepID=A0AAN9TLR3_9HEMI
MAEKRKVKRKKDEDFDFDNKKFKKPTKDEIEVAKWLKKNVPIKKTKFAGHNVEYFTGSKAVDALLNSTWSQKQGEKDPFFSNRQEIVNFMNNMLRHKLFHRAKKVPVSEQELKAKMKKKDKKSEKDEKKKKEEETAESSHAEGRETEEKKQGMEERQKKCKKIKLEMHFDQIFVDNLDAYVWIFDPIPFYYWIIGFLVVIGAIAICLFPLWPPTVRMGVQYLSMGAAGLLILILALAVIRLIVFCIVWVLSFGTFHLWLLPNLTEDVGFFASFWPLYEYKYGKQIENAKNKKNKKKKAKESDAEDDGGHEKESKSVAEKDKSSATEKKTNSSEKNPPKQPKANDFDYDEEKYDENQVEDCSDDENDRRALEDDEFDESEDSAEYDQHDTSLTSSSEKKGPIENEQNSSKGKRISRNDSEETDTESSSHSQTGKDFEIIDKDDSDVRS